MSFNAKPNEQKQRPLPPSGPQHALCYAIIDLGTQVKSFPGQPPSDNPEVMFIWEFPHVPPVVFDQAKGAQRLAISQQYTVSLGDKAKLPKILKAWRKVSEIKDLAVELPAYAGKPCIINVEHNKSAKNGLFYANVGSKGEGIMAPMAGINYGTTENEILVFNLDEFSWAEFAKIPKWIQDTIKKCKEWPSILQKFGPEPVQQQTAQQTYTPPATQTAQVNNQPPVFNQNQTAAPEQQNAFQQNTNQVNENNIHNANDIVTNPFDAPPAF